MDCSMCIGFACGLTFSLLQDFAEGLSGSGAILDKLKGSQAARESCPRVVSGQSFNCYQGSHLIVGKKTLPSPTP